MFSIRCVKRKTVIGYATAASFIEIFNEEMHGLHLLSIILTADSEKAEHCLVGALEDCLHGMDVFIDWARTWARRAIVKRAIMVVNPVPQQAKSQSSTNAGWRSTSNNDNLIGALFSLGAFERFVFVLSILERQSDEDCSALLGCRRRDIQSARVQALSVLSDGDSGCEPFKEALQAWVIVRALQRTPEET